MSTMTVQTGAYPTGSPSGLGAFYCSAAKIEATFDNQGNDPVMMQVVKYTQDSLWMPAAHVEVPGISGNSGNVLGRAVVTIDVPEPAYYHVYRVSGAGTVAAYLAAMAAPSNGPTDGAFGNGADGDVTLNTGTTTLTRDMLYNTLTVPSSAVLQTAGFRVFCKTSCTVASGGAVKNEGGAASGGTAGAASAAGTLLGGAIGGAGGVNNGSNGVAVTAALGGAGGAGGAGSGTTAGTAGTATAPTAAQGSVKVLPQAVLGMLCGNGAIAGITGGGGGSGGGGDTTNAGGGGGGGGGVIVIAARTLTIAGTVSANGGAGGAAATGNAGGGGGGGGGAINLIYRNKLVSGTVSVAGGAYGARAGTGSNGSAGSAGTITEVLV